MTEKNKSANEDKGCELHLICQTHWDREWRYPFQRTRMMLVRMMDNLLDIMDRYPKYKYYHLDSQTILLEDYLEIRPENRDRLKAYIKQGRILVGPWYTLPEENLLNGESLVRNLLIGHKVSKELGGTMKVGFTPTSFGQVSQMPQIYLGFDIDSIVFHRGVPAHEVKLEYLWEGADGSRILAIRPPLGGRFNFLGSVFLRVVFGEATGPYCEAPCPVVKDSFRLAEEDCSESFPVTVPGKQEFHGEQIIDGLNTIIQQMKKDATTPYLVVGQGHDWSGPSAILPKIVDEANRLLDGDRLILSSYPKYVAKLKSKLGKLKTLKGEMRSTQKDKSGGMLYPGVLSSRMYLKQMNRRAEFLLGRWAEPVAALAWIMGEEYPQLLLEKSWKWLLSNQTHDGLSGTGVDQVHRDMVHRFEQIQQVARNVFIRSLGRIIRNMDTSLLEKDEIALTVFNPSTYPRSEVVSLTLDLPQEWAAKFDVRDSENRPLPYQIVDKKDTISTIQRESEGLAFRLYVTRVKLHLSVPTIPSLGYSLLRISRRKADKAKNTVTELAPRDRYLENEFLKVRINTDGTLKINDKETGRTFDGLHYFEDGAEIGDAYEHRVPSENKIVASRRTRAKITPEENGSLLSRYRVDIKMKLPQAIDAKKLRRSRREKTLSISSMITLKKDARRVEIVTTIDNNIKDHRLRVLFPTGINATHSCAETPFDVVTRPIKLPDTTGWIEPASSTHPQLNFVDVSDGKAGLAVVNEGLTEYEVVDDENRTLAITLLRCLAHKVRATQLDDPSQRGSQCPGIHEFRYAICPHEGDWKQGDIFRQAYSHNLPLRVVQSAGGNKSNSKQRRLPTEKSFLDIKPHSLVLSSFKKSEKRKSIILRLFNPTDTRLEGRLSFWRNIKHTWLVNLNEDRIKELSVNNGKGLSFVVRPKKIITVELVL
jgi:alpha-mannosidase